MLSKMSALADMSHKCDKKSSRTFQRNFFEEKFLSGRPPGEGSPSLRLRRKFTHSCAQLTHIGFRALRSATKGSAFGIRKPSRRLDPSFASCGADWNFCQHNADRANFCRIDRAVYVSVLSKQADTKPSPRFTVTFGQVGKGDRAAVDEVRPRSGRAVMTSCGEVKICASR